MNRPRAIIFDMDGIIYDTERIYQHCFIEVGKRHGLEKIEQFFDDIIGTNDEHTGMVYTTKYRYDLPFDAYNDEVNDYIDEYRDGKEAPFKPGAKEFLEYLSAEGVPFALVSSTDSQTVLRDLKRSGIHDLFHTVITGDMVTNSKPDPEGFLRAAASLGVEPSMACVIEDSHNGIRAASAGGFRPIMLPDLMPVTEEMKELAETVLPDMDALKAYLFD